VQLMKTATLIGEVLTPLLVIEEGAKLQGVTDMGVTPWTDELPKLPGGVSDLSAHRAKQVVLLIKRPAATCVDEGHHKSFLWLVRQAPPVDPTNPSRLSRPRHSSGMVMAIPPMTSLSLKSRFGLSR